MHTLRGDEKHIIQRQIPAGLDVRATRDEGYRPRRLCCLDSLRDLRAEPQQTPHGSKKHLGWRCAQRQEEAPSLRPSDLPAPSGWQDAEL